MWEIRDHTPFASAWTIGIDKTGEKHWIVVTKGTFDIAHNGETKIAEEQVDPLFAPVYRGKPGESSLLYEQDLLPPKPRTDIYLNATAHTPHLSQTEKVLVGIQTPRGNKHLVVYGDRIWESALTGNIVPSTPKPFSKMPIVYERAYGGYDQNDPDPANHRLDPRNPVGTGLFTKYCHNDGELMPNIEHYKGGKDNAWAAGFGALCSYWKPRIDFQGTYDDGWVEKRKPLLPDDYNSQSLQCAPPDQQCSPHLRGGESFKLMNLTPNGAFRFDLPRHRLAYTTYIGSRRLEHRALINTVVIEPDYPRVIIVWHTTMQCHHNIDNIDFTSISEKEY